MEGDDSEAWRMATNVPKVGKLTACLAFFMNLILPGTGTIMAACSSDKDLSKT